MSNRDQTNEGGCFPMRTSPKEETALEALERASRAFALIRERLAAGWTVRPQDKGA